MKKLNRSTLVTGLLSIIALVQVVVAAPCNYSDPWQFNCCGGQVTCRMIGDLMSGGLPGDGPYDCGYLWCDRAVICTVMAEELPYAKKWRTKIWYYTDSNTHGCPGAAHVIDVTDLEVNCCDCTMNAPPNFPTCL